MRTNIEIDDELMATAMKAGPYTTKKEAVEAGLKLLARQAAYREVLKWRGKLKWEGDESIDWVAANKADAERAAQKLASDSASTPADAATKRAPVPASKAKVRRAGR